MNVTDDLRKLSEMRREGELTEQEFAAAKQRALAGNGPDWGAPYASPSPSSAKVPSDEEKVFKSSRWSSHNFFFPDRLTLASDGIIFRKGAMFGSREEHISYHAIASFRSENGIFLSTLSIETSGGSQPIVINGLWKSDSRAIQESLRVFQSHG